MTKETSNKIANMGIISALLVVFYHVPGGGWDGRVLVYAKLVGKLAVPFFFMASGYLLAGHFQEEDWYGRAVSKRIQTLYVPMVFWSILYFLFRILIAGMRNVHHGAPYFDNLSIFPNGCLSVFAQLFGIHPFRQPYMGVFWFVRTLLMLVLLSPLLKRFATPAGVLASWIALGIFTPDYDSVPFSRMLFTFNRGAFPILSAPYFLAGMMFRDRNANLHMETWTGVSAMIIGITMVFIRGHFGLSGMIGARLSWMSIPFLIHGFWTMCPKHRFPDILVSSSFPVYALHGFVIWSGASIPAWALHCRTAFGLSLFVGCVLISAGLRHCFPRISAILFGGR